MLPIEEWLVSPIEEAGVANRGVVACVASGGMVGLANSRTSLNHSFFFDHMKGDVAL